MSGFYIFLILLCCFTPGAFGQIYNFSAYSLEEGLPQSQVTSIYQDSKGYLWFGTNGGGLSRFDGYKFVSYTTGDSLWSNRIIDITEDADNQIWVSTEGGLNRISAKKITKIHTTFKPGQLLSDANGKLWAASGEGVFIFEQEEFQKFQPKQIKHANNIFQDANNNIWIAGEGIVYRWQPEKLDSFALPGTAEVNAITQDKSGFIWAATSHGAFKLDSKGFKKTNLHPVLKQKAVKNIFASSGGELWFATGYGAFRYDGKITHFDAENGLNSNIILDIHEDSEGNIWLGTSGSGAMQYKGNRFTRYTMEQGKDVNLILDVTADQEGKIWVGTYSGLYTLKDQKIIPFLVSNFYKQFTIDALLADTKGNVWYSVREYGVFRFGNKFNQFTSQNGLPSDNITSLLEDKKGNIWMGSDKGLIKWNGRFEIFQKEFFGRQINVLAEDHKGNILIGTDNGLMIYDGESFHSYSEKEGLPNPHVKSIIQDDYGTVWLATDNGLAAFNGKGFIAVTQKEGLNSNLTNSLIICNEGNLWVGTNRGIDKLLLKDFYEKKQFVFHHFGKEDGFTGVECNNNAVFKDDAGNLWFGTVKGLIKYDPASNKKNTVPPKLHLTGIRQNFKEFDYSLFADSISMASAVPGKFNFPYDYNHLTFDFAGINFTAPGKIAYRFKLEGFDDEWSPPVSERSATYTNLPPGKFIFKVQAFNSEGIASAAPAAMAFTIARPFWLTWWFMAALIFSGLAVSGFIFYVIARRKVKKRELNERIAHLKLNALRTQMNPHFIFNSLNSIQNFINKNDEEAANIYLSKFATLMRLILDNSRQNTVPVADELKQIELYLELEKLRFKDKFDYAIEVDPELKKGNYEIPAMLVQPYIENAINHGIMHKKEKGFVKVKMTLHENILQCIIEDDGIGRQKAIELKQKRAPGHRSASMSITEERLQVLNTMSKSKMGIKVVDLGSNGTDRGTRVEIEIPVE